MQTSTAPKQLAAQLYALITYLNKRCNANLFEAMGLLELTITQVKLLHRLEGVQAPVTVKQAGELVRLSLPAASRMVDDLVHRGLIERHEDHEDRRMKRISLTPEGRSAISRINAARLGGLERFADSLEDEQRDRLAFALDLLLQRSDLAACRPEGDTQP